MSTTKVDTIKDLLHLHPKDTTLVCYLEYKSSAENSFKFYELKVVPTSPTQSKLIARWGRIGDSGQTKEYLRGTNSECLRKSQDLKMSKVKKGYKRVE